MRGWTETGTIRTEMTRAPESIPGALVISVRIEVIPQHTETPDENCQLLD